MLNSTKQKNLHANNQKSNFHWKAHHTKYGLNLYDAKKSSMVSCVVEDEMDTGEGDADEQTSSSRFQGSMQNKLISLRSNTRAIACVFLPS